MPNGCVYCGSSNFSVEHHVLRCLGNFRGNQTIVDRICGGWNNNFKLLDEQLCRSSEVAFFREHLGIQGRKRQEKAPSIGEAPAGSLDRHKATKGLFVTTSTFSPATRETSDFLRKWIVRSMATNSPAS